jgi:hypothetical protein
VDVREGLGTPLGKFRNFSAKNRRKKSRNAQKSHPPKFPKKNQQKSLPKKSGKTKSKI